MKKAPEKHNNDVFGHYFRVAVQTPQGVFNIEGESIDKLNGKVEEMGRENLWDDFLILNVKINLWV